MVATLFGLVVVGANAPASADTPSWRVTGEVEQATSRWSRGGAAIVTESVLLTDDGQSVPVRQLGGTVDGIRMEVVHGPPVLRVGDRVMAELTQGRDLRGRTSNQVHALYAAAPAGHDATGSTMPFVRTVATETRVPLYWESGCALITFHQSGTSHIEGDGEITEMRASLAEWNQSVTECSYMRLVEDGFGDGAVGLDTVNMIRFRDDEWCRPATEDEPAECYDPDAAGLTTLFFVDDEDSARNGALLDADIELNAVHFRISVDGESTQPSGCQSDLANTFTHEIGHLLGLDHTCFTTGEQLVDGNGDPQPSCSPQDALTEAQREATMFAFQDCGETKKATVEADDVAGICAMYPASADPGECAPPTFGQNGCCSTVRADSPTALGYLLLLALGLIPLRRRRSN